jgi:hypothetical protein
VFGQKRLHHFQLHNDFAAYDKIGLILPLKRAAVREKSESRFTFEGNVPFDKFEDQTFVINFLGKSVSHFLMYFEDRGREIIAGLLMQFGANVHLFP